jgi:hypothetical protein
MTRLHPDDIREIARQVAVEMKRVEEIRLDEEFFASLPLEEMEKRAKEDMRRARKCK